MIYMNLKNFELYKNLYDTRIKGPVVEIDEMIAPAISELNKKGFTTRSCCSGHVTDYGTESLKDNKIGTVPVNDTYVSFIVDRYIEDYLLSNIPTGFVMCNYKIIVTDSGSEKIIFSFRKNLSNDSTISKQISVYNNCMRLYIWATRLLNANDINKGEDK